MAKTTPATTAGGMERSGVNDVLEMVVDVEFADELDVKHVQDSEPGFLLEQLDWVYRERCLICRV